MATAEVPACLRHLHDWLPSVYDPSGKQAAELAEQQVDEAETAGECQASVKDRNEVVQALVERNMASMNRDLIERRRLLMIEFLKQMKRRGCKPGTPAWRDGWNGFQARLEVDETTKREPMAAVA